MARAILLAGLGFGDEGKGRMTDALAREHAAGLVVRYNGGAQAAHHVVTDDGREHCFAQFGSGTLAGASTYLSRYVTLDLPALRREALHLQQIGVTKPFQLLYVDPLCPVVTPHHRALNWLRELSRGSDRHGSCGLGIGEVAREIADHLPVLRVEHFFDGMLALQRRLTHIQTRLVQLALREGFGDLDCPDAQAAWQALSGPSQQWLVESFDALRQLQYEPPPISETVIFEGAQGVLLDEWYGFHPHTTWSTCTFENAHALCDRFGIGPSRRLSVGITRTFHTRHGAGPMPSELSYRDVPLSWIAHERNTVGNWQGAFRYGALDLGLLAYACNVVKPDALAVTHMDVLPALQDFNAVYTPVEFLLRTTVTGLHRYAVPNTRDAEQLNRQAELTHRLLNETPIPLTVQSARLLDHIETVAGCPVAFLAVGPTASSTETREPEVLLAAG